jgi:indole-3-glycerol phosphate synthase
VSLENILESTMEAVKARRKLRPLEQVIAQLEPRVDDHKFLQALQGAGIGLIAEFKRRSPSEGALGRNPDVATVVKAYEGGGASAVSVLTEASKFGGSADDLRAARAACRLPLLCKDFVLDEYQIYEAAEAGADAILLIAAVLGGERDRLQSLYKLARHIGLDVLVEVRDEAELAMALETGTGLVGINNRDLRDLTTNVETTRTLSKLVPDQVVVVSESGLKSPDDLRALLNCHVDAALIGTALMNAADPEKTCRALVSATSDANPDTRPSGRQARSGQHVLV